MAVLDTEQVRWLLAHLYDNAALANVPFLISLSGLASAAPQERADTVRSLLLDAIEFLRPARREPLRSPAAHSYAVLWLRYVEGLSILQVGEELALSERQTHRELRAAEAKLTEVLADQLARLEGSAMPPSTSSESSIEVQARPAQVELQQVVLAVVQTVRPLAERLAVPLCVDVEAARGRAFLDEGILRQLLIQALSLAVQSAAGGKVNLGATGEAGSFTLTISFPAGPTPLDQDMVIAVERLAQTLHVEHSLSQALDTTRIAFRIPLRQPRSILAIEDSSGAIELYRRYLEPTGEWRIVAVPEPRLAYDMARSIQPALIILDLLMPGTDGWSILNLLHAHEETGSIPVIVCSVFQDPLLAEALGAKAHLRKPVSQLQLLQAVKKWAR